MDAETPYEETAYEELPPFPHRACWQLIPGVILVASWDEGDALVTYNLPVVDGMVFPDMFAAVRSQLRLALTYGQA